MSTHPRQRIDADELDRLFGALAQRGYTLVGPTARDGAIVYDELSSAADLPVGWTDEQDGGTYRLRARSDGARFGFTVGPHSWKRYLFPPSLTLWRAQEDGDGGFHVEQTRPEPTAYAFVGVRACELHAMAIQDRVFLNNNHPDPVYADRRERAFIVAVNCTEPSGTCFCASMETGPRVTFGYDIALTEVISEDEHYVVAEPGSDRGSEVLSEIDAPEASGAETQLASNLVEQAADRMGRTMETDGIKELLQNNLEHPRWERIAERCLSCGNCTQVCPTCFCSTVEDVTDLTGQTADRVRYWDSCFNLAFSYVHGGPVRNETSSRYRQWMTHKLAHWIDQFGTSGCVGCGRCITWCPVGIDITAEVRAIRATRQDGPAASATGEGG